MNDDHSRVHSMIAKALGLATGSLEKLADEIGVTRFTLRLWASGERNPTPGNLKKLADAFERRGGELSRVAKELRKASGN